LNWEVLGRQIATFVFRLGGSWRSSSRAALLSVYGRYKGQAFSHGTEPGWLNLVLDQVLVRRDKPRQVEQVSCRKIMIRDVWLQGTKKCKTK